MSDSAPLAHDHPRVVRCSLGMTAVERKALWPHGVSVAQVEVMERRDGLTPYRSNAAPAKAATPAAPSKSVQPIDTGFNRPPGGAVRGGGGGGLAPVRRDVAAPAQNAAPKPVNPLAAAAANVMAAFNRENSE